MWPRIFNVPTLAFIFTTGKLRKERSRHAQGATVLKYLWCLFHFKIVTIVLIICKYHKALKRLSSVQLLSHIWRLQPYGLQHARPPCPSPTPRVYPNSSPLSRWCHPAISSSVVPFSSCPQSFPVSGSFPMSQFFESGGQSIGVSASASVLPMNIQLISFRMDWLDLLSVQGTLKSLLQHHSSKASILWCSAFYILQLSHPWITTGKTATLTRQTFISKVMSLLFNMLSRLVIAFLPRSKRLLISWL